MVSPQSPLTGKSDKTWVAGVAAVQETPSFAAAISPRLAAWSGGLLNGQPSSPRSANRHDCTYLIHRLSCRAGHLYHPPAGVAHLCTWTIHGPLSRTTRPPAGCRPSATRSPCTSHSPSPGTSASWPRENQNL